MKRKGTDRKLQRVPIRQPLHIELRRLRCKRIKTNIAQNEIGRYMNSESTRCVLQKLKGKKKASERNIGPKRLVPRISFQQTAYTDSTHQFFPSLYTSIMSAIPIPNLVDDNAVWWLLTLERIPRRTGLLKLTLRCVLILAFLLAKVELRSVRHACTSDCVKRWQ